MEATTIAQTQHKVCQYDDHAYARWLAAIQLQFDATLAAGDDLVFTTDAAGLFDTYLAAIDTDHRQHYTCNTCRAFVERFGGLVTIREDGSLMPLIFSAEAASAAPAELLASAIAVHAVVQRARVTGVFRSVEPVWGISSCGGFDHFSVTPPARIYHGTTTLSAHQAMAVKRENYGIVRRALAEYSAAIVDQAVALLDADALYRSEKVQGPAKFLQGLHAAIASTKDTRRQDRLVWRAIATAPDGFCHPRSSMVGTLLDDLARGMVFDDVKRRFADKMRADVYQRPQTDPSAQNIAQAEKLVEQMGLAPSLRRRFATLDDIVALWHPATAADQAEASGVFGHLKPKEAVPSRMNIDGGPVTFEKLARLIDGAERIELQVPYTGNFAALVTAAVPDAPPLLQWDEPHARNPVAWYLYHGGSQATNWGLTAGCFVDVKAITLQPNMWAGDLYAHQGAGALFVLDGCRDTRSPGLALFPECLRPELHAVRKTIEAFSNAGKIEGAEQATTPTAMKPSNVTTPRQLSDCYFSVGQPIAYPHARSHRLADLVIAARAVATIVGLIVGVL